MSPATRSCRILRYCLAVLAAAGITGSAAGPMRHYYLTTATSQARSLAMGSSFIAIEDRLFALFGNPAGYTFSQEETTRVVRCRLNPLLPLILMNDLGYLGTPACYRHSQDDLLLFLASLAAAIKSLNLETRVFFAELAMLEELPWHKLRTTDRRFFSGQGLFENHTNSLLVHLKLASTISLGFTGNLYYLRDDQGRLRRGGGISYGILLRPSARLSLGLAYFNFPDQFPYVREPLERIGDETINTGIAYRFTEHTRATLDIRNLTDDAAVAPREIHLGAESVFLGLVALRAGFYHERFDHRQVYSCGAGLSRNRYYRLPWLSHRVEALDYSLLFDGGGDRVWHALTFVYSI